MKQLPAILLLLVATTWGQDVVPITGDFMQMKDGTIIWGEFIREDMSHILFYRDGASSIDQRSFPKSAVKQVVLDDNSVVWPPPKSKPQPRTTPRSTQNVSDNYEKSLQKTRASRQSTTTQSPADRVMALGLISLIIIIATYLIPTIIAGIRAASHSGAIFALNLLLGWTFIGWVGALIWAMVADKKQNQPTTQAEPAKAKEVTGYHCPHCGAKVEVAGSAFCHACGGAL